MYVITACVLVSASLVILSVFYFLPLLMRKKPDHDDHPPDASPGALLQLFESQPQWRAPSPRRGPGGGRPLAPLWPQANPTSMSGTQEQLEHSEFEAQGGAAPPSKSGLRFQRMSGVESGSMIFLALSTIFFGIGMYWVAMFWAPFMVLLIVLIADLCATLFYPADTAAVGNPAYLFYLRTPRGHALPARLVTAPWVYFWTGMVILLSTEPCEKFEHKNPTDAMAWTCAVELSGQALMALFLITLCIQYARGGSAPVSLSQKAGALYQDTYVPGYAELNCKYAKIVVGIYTATFAIVLVTLMALGAAKGSDVMNVAEASSASLLGQQANSGVPRRSRTWSTLLQRMLTEGTGTLLLRGLGIKDPPATTSSRQTPPTPPSPRPPPPSPFGWPLVQAAVPPAAHPAPQSALPLTAVRPLPPMGSTAPLVGPGADPKAPSMLPSLQPAGRPCAPQLRPRPQQGTYEINPAYGVTKDLTATSSYGGVRLFVAMLLTWLMGGSANQFMIPLFLNAARSLPPFDQATDLPKLPIAEGFPAHPEKIYPGLTEGGRKDKEMPATWAPSPEYRLG